MNNFHCSLQSVLSFCRVFCHVMLIIDFKEYLPKELLDINFKSVLCLYSGLCLLVLIISFKEYKIISLKVYLLRKFRDINFKSVLSFHSIFCHVVLPMNLKEYLLRELLGEYVCLYPTLQPLAECDTRQSFQLSNVFFF